MREQNFGIEIEQTGLTRYRAAPFDARTLRNLVNIVYAKEDMIYRALQVERGRERQYCRKTD
ncbi:MAG: amidoligase family protein, partial [Christensenellaceae bacterium]